MKRVDKLTELYLSAYLSGYGESKTFIENSWGPLIFFRSEHFGLRKLSIRVSKNLRKKDGTINLYSSEVQRKLRAEIRERIIDKDAVYFRPYSENLIEHLELAEVQNV